MKFITTLSAAIVLFATGLFAQTYTSGEISGLVTDSSGAVINQASVTILNKDTGTQRATKTNHDGYYRAPLLPPGTYAVTVTVPSFRTFTRNNVMVDVGHSVHLDFQMQLGSVETRVEVEGQAPIIEPSNPNTTTTYNTKQLEDTPNAGNDLSHVAVVAPGAIMNVVSSNSFSAGNVEFNGLPSVANDFTIDGLDANDSWENLNQTGATGLQLGLSSIQEASVNTEAYGADKGRYGASQINFVTKSGTNSFHGSLFEIWNGSALNSTNYFINAVHGKKPRSNVNQFGGSFGGPIMRKKLFFFGSVEGTRVIVPSVLTSVLPTPDYEKYVLQQLPLGGFDPVIGANLPPQPAEVPYYQKMFSLMGDTSKGTSYGAIPGCPFNVGGISGNGCANQRTFSISAPARETLYTAKVDYDISPKDTTWYRMQWDDGFVNSNPNPVNPVFDVSSTWPQRSVVAGWTHTFSPELLNEFNPGFTYWSRVHAANAQGTDALPITLSATPFSSIGVGQNIYGNSTRAWEIIDNVSWTRGRHGFKFGTNTRHTRFASFETVGYGIIPFVYTCSLQEFTYGATCQTFQAFPTYSLDHVQGVSMDNYAMDTIKVTSKLTVTVGLRVAWNSNPISEEGVLSRLTGTWESISHNPNQPLNQVILPHQQHLFADTYPFTWQPRAAFAYAITPKMVLRAGGGLFANPLLGFTPTYADENAPSDVFIQAGIFGPAGGIGMFPGSTSSAIDAAVAANQAFQAGFASGVVSCAASNPPPNCIPPISFTNFDSQKQKFPSIYQWSAALERQFGNDWGLTVKYVGTRTTHGFYSDNPNGYQFFCNGCFKGYPYAAAVDARFGNIFPFKTGTNSTYHGLQVSGQKRLSHGITFQANYTYSHCIDEVTNGGIIIFNYNENFSSPNGRLSRLHSNCDFDFRHSFNGSYIYELPLRSSKSWLNQVVGGWQVSGTVFARDGLPFSVMSSSFGFVNAFPPLFANVVPGQNPYEKKRLPSTQDGTIQWLNPYAFQSVLDPTTGQCVGGNTPQTCQDGDSGRNKYRTPNFFWSDFSITKRFRLTESVRLRFDTQMFNVFNHPNFGLPNRGFGYPGNATAGIPGEASTLTGVGTINNTVGPSTGLLGSNIGGDSSVRMIAFRIGLDF